MVARIDQFAVDELGRADVHAARRLSSYQELATAGELAGDDYFLLIAAGERASRHAHRASPNVEFLSDALGEANDGVAHDPDAVCEGRSLVRTQHEVVGHGVAEHQSMLLAIFRNMRFA